MHFVNGVSCTMSAGAAYPGSVETMQIIGDTQQTPTTTTTKQPQQLKITQQSNIQVLDGGGVVGETLVSGPPQQTIHLPQMATIVAAPGATPIIVPSSAQSRIAVAMAPNGALLATPATVVAPVAVPGQVIDFSLMNGSAAAGVATPSGNEATAVDGAASEYYFQSTGQPVAGAEVIIGGAAAPPAIVATGPVIATSDGTPIPLEQLKQLLGTQLEYYFSR